MVVGDWNGKLGQEIMYQPTIGTFCLHKETNKNGKLATEFAIERNLKIESTDYQHNEIHKDT